MNWRKTLGPLAGILISILFLALALYRVDFRSVVAALVSADYRLVALAAVFTFTSYLLRTARWRRLLQSQKHIPVLRLYPVLVIGFALNNLFPGRPGEFARAISLGQRESLSKTLGLATVVVERVADGVTLIAILAFLSLGFSLPGWGRDVELVAVAIFAVAFAGLVFLSLREMLASRILARVIKFVPPTVGERAEAMFKSFVLGLHSLRSPADLATVIVLSLAVWLSEATHYLLILSAFGILDGDRRAFAAVFALVIVNLGISIPAAPGGVGPFEAAGVLALNAFGVGRDLALPALLVAHTIQYLVVTGQGIVFTAREGVKLTQAVEKAGREKA